MRYVIIILALILTSCGKQKGCTNQLSSNYDREAEVDCCCEFDLEKIIDDLVGNYFMKETCSGAREEFEIEVSRSESSDSEIIISNFNNSGSPIRAEWTGEDFGFIKSWGVNDCDIEITGSLHTNSGKLYIQYAYIPVVDCDLSEAKTCQAHEE